MLKFSHNLIYYYKYNDFQSVGSKTGSVGFWPIPFRVARVRIKSGYGSQNLVQDPVFSGRVRVGFRVGSIFDSSICGYKIIITS